MDTAMSSELVEALSDPERSLKETAAVYDSVYRESLGEEEDDVFQHSLRLKSKLDELEAKVEIPDMCIHLALVVNGEHILHTLNAATPLRSNPFLSHWVEVVRSSERRLAERRVDAASGDQGKVEIDERDVLLTRLHFVRGILKQSLPKKLPDMSPKSLCKYFHRHPNPPCSVDRFIRILEDEGIYEKAPEVPVTRPDVPREPPALSLTQLLQYMLELDRVHSLEHLRDNVDLIRYVVVSLPLDIEAMETVISFLESGFLVSLGCDPADIVRDYIQHGLREIETMADMYARTSSPDWNERQAAAYVPGHGREAQIRAVQLLVLFIQSLIRKNFVAPQHIFFEIQEICVRFVWIGEARQLREFLAGSEFGLQG